MEMKEGTDYTIGTRGEKRYKPSLKAEVLVVRGLFPKDNRREVGEKVRSDLEVDTVSKWIRGAEKLERGELKYATAEQVTMHYTGVCKETLCRIEQMCKMRFGITIPSVLEEENDMIKVEQAPSENVTSTEIVEVMRETIRELNRKIEVIENAIEVLNRTQQTISEEK